MNTKNFESNFFLNCSSPKYFAGVFKQKPTLFFYEFFEIIQFMK